LSLIVNSIAKERLKDH